MAAHSSLHTLACHALMVPCLFRRASPGVQGPEYQLEAVELAVMRWSSISPLSIPKGTEQPAKKKSLDLNVNATLLKGPVLCQIHDTDVF